LRKGFEQGSKARGKNDSGEPRIGIDPKLSADRGSRTLDKLRGVADRGKQWGHLRMELATVFSKFDAPRCAVEKAHAKPGFEPGDGTADTGWREAESLRRPGKAPALDHRNQNADPIEQPGVKHE
jgi:hypothetical protein